MPPIRINGFVGGLARSLYESIEFQSYQTAKNLDVFGSSDILRPVTKLAAQATSTAMSTAKLEWAFPASDGNLYLCGSDGADKLQLYYGTLPATPGTMTITACTGTGGTSSAPNVFIPNASYVAGYHHCQELNGYLLHWSTPYLARTDLLTKTTVQNPYSFTGSSANVWGPIFVHQGLQKAFIGINNVVYTLDSTSVSGSSAPLTALTLDPRYIIRSFTAFGRFLLIGCQTKNDNGSSVVFVYDGSATTVEDVIDVGDSGLQSIRNVNGVVHILCTHLILGFPDAYMRVYLWQGGSTVFFADELRISPASESSVPGTRTITLIDDATVEVSGDSIYWGFRAYESTAAGVFLSVTNGVYCFGRSGPDKPRIDTLLHTTSTSADQKMITSIKAVQGTLVVLYNDHTTWYMDTTLSNSTYGQKSASGVYQSNAFRLTDGMGKGKVMDMKIRHEALPASCGFTVKMRTFGEYPEGTSPPTAAWVTIGTQTTAGTTFTKFDNISNYIGPAEYAQIEIDFDTVSGANAPGIIFPIDLDVEVTS